MDKGLDKELVIWTCGGRIVQAAGKASERAPRWASTGLFKDSRRPLWLKWIGGGVRPLQDECKEIKDGSYRALKANVRIYIFLTYSENGSHREFGAQEGYYLI